MTPDAKPDPADKPAKPRAKRRWYQFSLRAMFVWVAVVAVLLTVALRWIAPAQQQRAAVRMVKQQEGVVHYSKSPADENWLATRLRDLLPRDYFDSVEGVGFRFKKVGTDAALSSLAGLPRLKRLDLFDTNISDAGLVHLRGLKELVELDLGCTPITDSQMPYLKALTQLQWLNLRETRITGAGLAHLAGLTQLQWLDLEETQLTDGGLTHLSSLTELQWLHLRHTKISDAGLKHLGNLHQLQKLQLDHGEITHLGEQQLRDMLPKCISVRIQQPVPDVP